jgi:hypothetical protein
MRRYLIAGASGLGNRTRVAALTVARIGIATQNLRSVSLSVEIPSEEYCISLRDQVSLMKIGLKTKCIKVGATISCNLSATPRFHEVNQSATIDSKDHKKSLDSSRLRKDCVLC